MTKLIIVGILFLASLTSTDAATNEPFITIYESNWRLGSVEPSPRIISVIWRDGRIVWSTTNSGAPYRQSRISLIQIDSLLGALKRRGVFTNAALNKVHFGPDSPFTTILINDGHRRLKMQSWHEVFEARSNSVATAYGIEPLGKRSRESVLKQQPSEYRAYRAVWTEIRQLVRSLIPESGQPYNEKLVIRE